MCINLYFIILSYHPKGIMCKSLPIVYLFIFNILIQYRGYTQEPVQYIINKNALDINILRHDTCKITDSNIYIYGEFHDFRHTDDIALMFFYKMAPYKSKKIYLCEKSKSFEYVLDRWKKGIHEISYNKYTSINLKKDKALKKPILRYSKLLQDTNITFVAFDYEFDFGWALICLHDILIHTKNANKFIEDIQKIESGKVLNKENYEVTSLARSVVSKFMSDTLIYKSLLSNEEYSFYKDITASLKEGLFFDSLENAAINKKTRYLLREKCLYDHTRTVIESHVNDAVFIHTGLRHALDSTYISDMGEWVSMAEGLRNTYGNNICKILLVNLDKESMVENCTIFHKEEFAAIKKSLKYKTSFIDVKKNFPNRKTQANYAVLYN